MKNTTERRISRAALAVSIAVSGSFVSLPSKAEEAPGGLVIGPGSQIEAGIGYVSEGSYKFGDYGRGLQESGGYLVGNVRMNAYGQGAPSYLELNGRNLGLEGSRDLRIKTGEAGNYGLSFEYGELSKLHSDSFKSPYTGMGTSVLTKPSVWTITPAPGTTTVITPAMMADLAANMRQFNVETTRKAAAVGLTKQLAGAWDVVVNFRRENKEGTTLTGLPMQIGGQGNRGVVLAPKPIDYTTDLFDTAVRYAGEKLHAEIGYRASIFKDAAQPLVFDNLFYNSASTVGGNALTGRIGKAPDNQFHQIDVSSGYGISEETRLTGRLSIGRMTQNEAFLPYSTAAVPGALPAASLDGKIDTTHADIKVSSRLVRDVSLVAGYRYDDRDNKTPINTYTYRTADVTTAPGASNTRRNTPLSKNQRTIYADMDYRLSSATKLSLGYSFDKIARDHSATAGDQEHAVKAGAKHSFGDTASGGLAFAHSERKAEPYNGAASLASTYTSAYLASLCVAPNTFLYNGVVTPCTGTASTTSQATTPFLDTPALRKFFMANRKRDKLNAFANVAPIEKLDLQFGASYYREKYPEAETGFGRAKATGWATNFDANWAATETVSGNFFTSVENSRSLQNGHNGASSATGPITTLDRQNNTAAFDPLTGTVTLRDRSWTMGLGVRFKPEDDYELGGDLTRVNTKGSTGFSNLGALLTTVRPVPDTVSTLSRVELSGKYYVRKDVTLNMKYAHEKYDSTDWAWDGQTLTSSTQLIGSGQVSPDYSVNVISASLSYRF